jgi:hypothetical protein
MPTITVEFDVRGYAIGQLADVIRLLADEELELPQLVEVRSRLRKLNDVLLKVQKQQGG